MFQFEYYPQFYLKKENWSHKEKIPNYLPQSYLNNTFRLPKRSKVSYADEAGALYQFLRLRCYTMQF